MEKFVDIMGKNWDNLWMIPLAVWAGLIASVTYPIATIPQVYGYYSTSTPTLAEKIENYANLFDVNPLLSKEIIRCESGFDPYATGTQAHIGIDVGYWQINSYYHTEEALNRGFDIYEPEDNLRYGFLLLKEFGTAPWSASRSCWEK